MARFYSGCFSKGEVSALGDELLELSKGQPYKHTSHPRSIALVLLGDWVFTQYQPAVKRIIAFVGEYPQLRQLLANSERAGTSGWSTLPERSGRADFLEILWHRLTETTHLDERQALAVAIDQNSAIDERTERWHLAKESMDSDDWTRLGGHLRLFEQSDIARLSFPDGELSPPLIKELIEANQFIYLSDPARVEGAERALLNNIRFGYIPIRRAKKPGGLLENLAAMSSYYQYTIAIGGDHPAPLRHVLRQLVGMQVTEKSHSPALSSTLSANELAAIGAYNRFIDAAPAITSTSIEPWADFVRAMRAAWGDSPAIDRIAFMGAGVRSKTATGTDSRLEGAEDLVHAARFVRLKAGAPRWWDERLANESGIERRRLLLLLWLWGTPKTISTLSPAITEALNALDLPDWVNLYRDYRCLNSNRRQTDDVANASDSDIKRTKKRGPRFCVFYGSRLGVRSCFELGQAVSDLAKAGDSPELSFAIVAITQACLDKHEWKSGLPHIRSLYLKGAVARYVQRTEMTIPTGVAAQISAELESFPLSLVAAANAQLRSSAGEGAIKLLDVANRDGWFKHNAEKDIH